MTAQPRLIEFYRKTVVPQLMKEFGYTSAMAVPRMSKIIVNMGAVSYIDSTALGELVRGYTSAAKRGGGLKLLQVTPPVHQLLTMTRLTGVFQEYGSEADAVKSFGAASA